jgi:hypothetical protein
VSEEYFCALRDEPVKSACRSFGAGWEQQAERFASVRIFHLRWMTVGSVFWLIRGRAKVVFDRGLGGFTIIFAIAGVGKSGSTGVNFPGRDRSVPSANAWHPYATEGWNGA